MTKVLIRLRSCAGWSEHKCVVCKQQSYVHDYYADFYDSLNAGKFWISTQIKYKASIDADEVQLSREARDLNFKKSILLFCEQRRLWRDCAFTSTSILCMQAVKALLRQRIWTGLSGPCLLAYAININLVSIASACFVEPVHEISYF